MNSTCIEHSYEASRGRVSDFRQDLACAARSDVRILITGNDGVGKRSVAKAVHRWSRRRRAPFLAIDCAATPEAVLELEAVGQHRAQREAPAAHAAVSSGRTAARSSWPTSGQ